jgi:flagellar assembly protein FliH
MPIIKRVHPSSSGNPEASKGGSPKAEGGTGQPPLNTETKHDPFDGLEWNGSTERRQNSVGRRTDDALDLSAFKEAEAQHHALQQIAHKEGFNQGYDEGYAEGVQQGRASGHEAGYAEGMREAQEASNAIWDIISQLDSAKNTVLSEALEDLVPMAMAIAQRILKTEVACDRNLVVSLALDTFEKVDRTQKEIVFKVHPSDVARLRQHIQDNEEIWLGEVKRELIVVGDETVDMGSCAVETSGGQIDARFKTQLNVVRNILGLREEKEQVLSSENEFDHLLQTEALD